MIKSRNVLLEVRLLLLKWSGHIERWLLKRSGIRLLESRLSGINWLLKGNTRKEASQDWLLGVKRLRINLMAIMYT